MTFIQKLFGRGDKKAVEPMHGAPAVRNKDIEHQVHTDTRNRMEAEMASDRSRRAATPPTDSEQL